MQCRMGKKDVCFMNYKKSYTKLHIGVLLGIFFILCAKTLSGLGRPFVWVMLLLGTAVILCSIVQAKIYYKCPHCGKPLSLWAVMPHSCPGCGGELRR